MVEILKQLKKAEDFNNAYRLALRPLLFSLSVSRGFP